jgi:hypothetical protein
MSGRSLVLVVDELVLDGVEAQDPLVHRALSSTLGQALAEHGLADSTAQVSAAVGQAVGEAVTER